MSATGLDVFDKTLQTTHIWLDELMQDEAVGRDRQVAWYVLGVVLRAVRDRIPLELAVHLGSQLPLLVRGSTMTSGMARPDSREAPLARRVPRTYRRTAEPDPPHGSPRGDRGRVHGSGASCGPGAGREGQACPSGRGAGPLARGRHVGGGGA